MDTWPFIAALAVAWHLCLAIVERSRLSGHAKLPLAKLLLLAEVEVLRTLRAELKRNPTLRQEPKIQRKMREVEERLKELGEDAGRIDS